MSVLIKMAEAADSIAIVGHIRPDGDCIGSCLAAYNYLTEQYPEKEVAVYLQPPAKRFGYLANIEQISQSVDDARVYDLCICLDSGDVERLGENAVYYEHAVHTICIDHHITNPGYGEVNIVEPQASSASEVLYGLLEPDQISKAVAECIYTGILHDTNVFKNSNTTGKTMMIAGKMMEKGINFSKIIDESFYQKTYVQNQILGRALLESVVFQHGKCIFTAVRKADMQFYGVDSNDLEGIVDQLRVTEGVECAIFISETANHEYKVSMRSNAFLDVSKVAAYFGGGGHIRAAGCTLAGTVHDVINNLSTQIERQLKERDDGPLLRTCSEEGDE